MGKIVLVESGTGTRWRPVVAQALKKTGHNIVPIDNIAEARLYVKRAKPDLILTTQSVESLNDGLTWALELYEARLNVAILASHGPGLQIFAGNNNVEADLSHLIRTTIRG